LGRKGQTQATGAALRSIRIAFLLVLPLTVFSLWGADKKNQPSGKLDLDYVLSMMDHSAEDFHSLTAAIEHIKYTAVVKDSSSETGEIFVRKDSKSKEFKMRIDFQSPDPRTIIRNGDSLYIYTPKINRVEEYNIGKNRAAADQYLALGFGTRADVLRKSYAISLTGEEDLDGHKAALLELIPKSDEVKKQISKIQFWVDESSWLPIQQKFMEAGSGDYLLSHYTNVMKNLKLGDGKFKPDWPKGTKVEKPRG
jgi:outer membrane lipoprotein-sorting protein